ncbi:DEAD/DEAH box helicase family protein [Niameybacter massiliensis]|uniref:DEAD/DEAH box helicase family protein n=1 Tax=Niameybacter massiliensis TaxID=1658108 RepID=UPI0006B4A9C3|nr:DEAD/DEAH box helicase family protein [Niameybacter massiliensis]
MNIINTEQLKHDLLYKTSKHIDDSIRLVNAITGESDHLYNRLKTSMKNAQSIDIIVSFLMESGVKLLLGDLKEAINRGVKIRLLTGNYLHITEPSALYLIREALGERLDLRLYNVQNKSFHPKAYLFHGQVDSEIYVGSSNISRGALTNSVEWNYRFAKSQSPEDFQYFYNEFVNLFECHSTVVTDEVLEAYSKSWTKPKLFSKSQQLAQEALEEIGERSVIDLYEPRGAQIEALYALKNTREEGWERGLVVAATGIGKTYLAAFDSKPYKRVLFVAHREEILKQAEESFRKVRQTESTGFFYGNKKDVDKEVTFALVQTLGKNEYLNQEFFAADAFDYVIIDECHHAIARQYTSVLDYFTPVFWLFLTATPERMDNGDVFEIAGDNLVYEVRLQEAINKGWLVPFRYYAIYDETVNYDEIEYKNSKYDKQQLDAGLMISRRAELILKHYQKYSSKRAMGFCSSKSHAEYMAHYFNKQGIKAVAVYSGEQGEQTAERSEAIGQLRRGEIQIIFSVDMFNEGVDVPEVDMVLFLRPTQSTTIFLQQLGRGLRKCKGKEYLNVLDFIGNYKKANIFPFLLGNRPYTESEIKKMNPQTIELPEDCILDFDFRLIDLFKEMGKKSQNDLEKCIEEYERIKSVVGGRPTRKEVFIHTPSELTKKMGSKVLKDYLAFLKIQDELCEEEIALIDTRAGDFLQQMSITGMQRTYKMPLLLAFYNNGDIRLDITLEEASEVCKTFYKKGSNDRDLLQGDKKTHYSTWTSKEWKTEVLNQPINAFLKNGGGFFKAKEDYLLSLDEILEPYLKNPYFKKHFKEIIDYRVADYYRRQFEDKNKRGLQK